MNLKDYLQKKENDCKKREEEFSTYRASCLSCFRPEKSCFCKTLKPFATETYFCILMHPKEAKKEPLGTGHLSHVCLKNSRIIVDETFDQNLEVQKILNSPDYFCMLLYPGDHAHNITDHNFTSPLPSHKKRLIFVIDGTWSCAKSMMRESKTLHNLPRISFNTSQTSQFKIKQQPAAFCLSTIESFYYLLDGLKKWGHENITHEHQVLLEALDKLVDYQFKCARDPNKKSYRRGCYKEPSERKASKKWKNRHVAFDEKNYTHLKRTNHSF
ncbi:MAG: DTW domain-containing protein [Bacteriovoracaceae bacterium]|nr:DTW domain-containing protein [Bacteriovoracaceae bacterium]